MRRGPAPLEPKSGPLNGGTNLGQPKVRRSARIPTPRPANAARPATNSSRSAAREPSSEATQSRCSAAVVQLSARLGPGQEAAATIRPTATSQRRLVVGCSQPITKTANSTTHCCTAWEWRRGNASGRVPRFSGYAGWLKSPRQQQLSVTVRQIDTHRVRGCVPNRVLRLPKIRLRNPRSRLWLSG